MDSFKATWWNQKQCMAWVLWRDRDSVRRLEESDAFASAFVSDDVEFDVESARREQSVRTASEFKNYRDAEAALLEELRAGRISAVGLREGLGNPTTIPAINWIALRFAWRPPKVESSHPILGAKWFEVRFRRDEVIARWPDPNPEGPRTRVAWDFVPPGFIELRIAVARVGEALVGNDWVATERYLEEEKRRGQLDLGRRSAVVEPIAPDPNEESVTEFFARSLDDLKTDFDELVRLMRQIEYIREEHGKTYEEIHALTWGQRLALASSTKETAQAALEYERALSRHHLFEEPQPELSNKMAAR